MEEQMKIRALAAVGITASLALTACGGSSSGSSGSTSTTPKPGTIRLWLNGPDTPQPIVDYAVKQFEAQNPGSKVVFERQQWTGIVQKLTTSLSSSSSPDVVEMGNTDAQAFEAAGALKDITSDKAALGGDDLVQSLVDSGTYGGKFYGVPYYGGARVVVYRTDLFKKAGITSVPTSTQEFIDDGIKLEQNNAGVKDFSGIYLPGKYWYAALPFIWDNGGNIATQSGGKWTGQLASPGSVAGLTEVKTIMDKASKAPKDTDESKDYVAFCNNQVGMLMGPGWKYGQIIAKDGGCPKLAGKIGAFALPGKTAGSLAPAFLGGSNLAISAKSKNSALALSLLKIMTGAGYQQQLAAIGLLPAKKSLLPDVKGDVTAAAQSKAATNTRFTPESPNWAGVEASSTLQDMLVGIAKGGDVSAQAKQADSAIEAALNQ
jgi:N,N'-diacetylchitobiose transport system substrate-binding protein